MAILALWLASSGILWLPVATLTTAYVARSQGLPPLHYALKGACRSFCFVIPWVHLILRMHLTSPTSNYKVPGNVALLMYVPALLAWLIFGIGFVLWLSIAKVYQLANLSDHTLQYDDVFIKAMIGVAVVGFTATLVGLAWGYYSISLIRDYKYKMPIALPEMASAHETPTSMEPISDYHTFDIGFQRRLHAEYSKFSKPWFFFFGWLAFGFCYLVAVLLSSEW